MPVHMCGNCERVFKQKGHLESHKKRKNPCKKDSIIEKIIEKKVADVLANIDKKRTTALLETPKLNLNRNTSPLRYPGGKTRAIGILYEYLRTYYPERNVLLSPFFGGGSFELCLSVNGYTVYGNDLFIPLYNFWVTKQENCKTLVTNIKEKLPVSKQQFHELRDTIMNESDNIKMSTSYFIINRTSFSGSTLSGGFSEQASKHRLTESSINRLSECNVDSIVFSNLDCNAFLDVHPETSDTVIYADPPYYITGSIYGKNGDMHERFDHAKFAENIRKRRDWIISYNDCEYIKNLYKGCRIFTTSWSYSMNKSKTSSEIIILPPLSS